MRILALLISGLLFSAVLVRAEDKINLKQFSEVKIRIVDEKGKPIKGARVRVFLLGVKSGEETRWDSKADKESLWYLTNDEGNVKLPYPEYDYFSSKVKTVTHYSELETTKISLAVTHDDYICIEHDCMLKGDSEPIVLKQGINLKITGMLPEGIAISKNLYSIVDNETPYAGWRMKRDVLNSPALKEGELVFSLIHYPEDGPVHYSRVQIHQLNEKSEKNLRVELNPGINVLGKLDSSVPRPVKNGKIYFRSYLPLDEDTEIGTEEVSGDLFLKVRYDQVDVNPDGTFKIDSLPLDSRLEFVADCDGYVSQCRSEKLKNGRRMTYPQFCVVSNGNELISVQMEKAGSCEVHVINKDGEPVPNAEVACWPNIIVPGGASMFGSTNRLNYHSHIKLLSESYHKSDWVENIFKNRDGKYSYESKTDQFGVAVIKKLPSGGVEPFDVEHDNYQPSYENDILLKKGEKVELIVMLKKR